MTSICLYLIRDLTPANILRLIYVIEIYYRRLSIENKVYRFNSSFRGIFFHYITVYLLQKSFITLQSIEKCHLKCILMMIDHFKWNEINIHYRSGLQHIFFKVQNEQYLQFAYRTAKFPFHCGLWEKNSLWCILTMSCKFQT